jgi:3-phosphoshikimate 1-carboxyvinyltransferase
MSFSIASLRAAAPIRIADVTHVATSFPDFPGIARAAGLNVQLM